MPAECEAGYFLEMHPFLAHYLTAGNPCTEHRHQRVPGTRSRAAPAAGARSAFDLSAYAGKQVEVSIAYVSDPFTGGTGLFIDDTKVTTTGGTLDAEGFESGLGPVDDRRRSRRQPGQRQRVRPLAGAVIDWSSAVTTEDSVLLGFGLEQVASGAERNALMGKALQHLLG